MFKRSLFRIAALALTFLALPQEGAARCAGKNLLADLPAADSAELAAATAAQPYAQGNLWRASKGDRRVYLLGTYHMPDARHAATVAEVTPLLAGVDTLLVEAGPEEERALKREISSNPGLLFLTEGPSLLERFGPEEWAGVAAALEARKMPAFMAAKMRPWYLATMLGIAPCDMAEAQAGRGLDHLVMEQAAETGVPVRALEPFTTLFAIFDELSMEEQLDMLRATLQMEPQIADFATTMADGYFAGDTRRIWEYMRLSSHDAPGYTPEKAEAEFARMEDILMTRRNKAWIPVIEETSATGPTFAAFGALHLAGKTGVLNLLAEQGWTVERIVLPSEK